VIEHASPISGISAYRDQYVATAGYDNQVILWDQRTARSLTRAVHDHLANQCTFSPDGSMLVTSSSDYTARLWTVPDLRLRAVLNDQDDDVEMSVFHPVKELIATASRDHKLRVYDYQGNLIRRFTGHTADVISVEWAGDADELITSSDDGTVKRWSLASGELVADIDLGGVETDTIAISPDGTLYAGNDDGEIVVIRQDRAEDVPAHASGVKRLVLNGERNLLVSLSYDRSMLLWSTAEGGLRQVHRAEIPDDVWPRSCAFAGGSTIVFGTFGASYRTYDYGQHEWLDATVHATGGINAVAVSQGHVFTVGDAGIVRRDDAELTRIGSLCNFLTPASSLIVTGGQLGKAADALTGRVLHQHRSPLNCGARFFRDGVEHVVLGAYTGEGLVFEVLPDGGLRHVAEVQLHQNAVKGIAVSGDYIFSVCADTSVAWHSVRTLEPLRKLPNAHDRIANGCVGLGDGYVASVGRDLKLRLWSPDFTARVVETSHPNSIKCISASTSGQLIASGSYHGHVKVYDRARDAWIAEERPTTAGISSLAYDANREIFLASSYDGKVYEIHGQFR
jgi:toxoflavin biosynthesis protein ToxC